MTVFRSDYSRYTSPSATSQHYTNTDFRGKPDPSLNRPREDSKLVYPSALNITIFADPIVVSVTQHGLLSQWPAVDRDPALDQEFDCEYWETIPVVTVELGGTWLNETIFADPIVITVSQEGNIASGIVIPVDPIVIIISLNYNNIALEYVKANWVKWSKIGCLDFTIDESNVANERPLNQHGFVYRILKLDNTLIAYGESGVTALIPKDVVYGIRELYNVGLLSWSAVTGTDFEHFFIDVSGKLFRVLPEELKELDYSEFLSQMTFPVMFLDQIKNLLYICDGTYGFIYNIHDESFGSGPVNLTGIGSRGNIRYLTAPTPIIIPKFEVCTDIYDMGTRKPKNIHSVEIATDLSEHLQLLIEFRISNREEFRSSPWFLVNPDGIAYSPCYGIEFKFRIRSFILEQFKIDRLKINGSIHGFSHRDYLAMTKQSL
jgi:hypothetical protein